MDLDAAMKQDLCEEEESESSIVMDKIDPNTSVKQEPCDSVFVADLDIGDYSQDNTYDGDSSNDNLGENRISTFFKRKCDGVSSNDNFNENEISVNLNKRKYDGVSSNDNFDENGISKDPVKRKCANTSSSVINTEKESNFSCPICKMVFLDITTLIRHLDAVHKDYIPCPEMKVEEMLFLSKWGEKVASKKGNNLAISLEKYKQTLAELKIANSKTKNFISKEDTWRYNNIKRRYDIVTIEDREFLIRKKKDQKDKSLYYVANEHLYEKINEIHLAHGHAGRDKMLKLIGETYYNITSDAVKLYVELCQECDKRRINRAANKAIVVKPIRRSDFDSRCHVDLIDMQTDPDGEYKWILNYQDHFSKFIQLRPLKSESAKEIANTIVEIFLTGNGAPRILQSKREPELINEWITEIARQWPGMKLVRGKSYDPQSQESIESANKEVEKQLAFWLGENPSKTWTDGLLHVQFQKNATYHSKLKMTPCEVLYGQKASRGLWSTDLPPESFNDIKTEDDLVRYLNKGVNSDSNDAQANGSGYEI